MKRFNRHRAWVAAVTLLATIALGGTVVASADGNQGPADANSSPFLSEDAIAGQTVVMEFLDPFGALVNPREDGVGADGVEYGFSGVETDPQNGAVDVYWVGDVPQNVREIVAAAPPSLTITFHPARFRLKEMLDGVDAIFTATLDKKFPGNVALIKAGPEISGSGIWVGYTGDATPDEVIELLSPFSPLPISSAESSEPIQLTSRWDDEAPFDGGSGYFPRTMRI